MIPVIFAHAWSAFAEDRCTLAAPTFLFAAARIPPPPVAPLDGARAAPPPSSD